MAKMKHLLLTTIAAVVLVGCGPSPNELINEAARVGDIEAVKQALSDGADVRRWMDGRTRA
jgi:PBP1b-binding outer membrane lipoprotein LpoB